MPDTAFYNKPIPYKVSLDAHAEHSFHQCRARLSRLCMSLTLKQDLYKHNRFLLGLDF